MKEIRLTQGKAAIVDDADFPWLNQWKWYTRKAPNTYDAAKIHHGEFANLNFP